MKKVAALVFLLSMALLTGHVSAKYITLTHQLTLGPVSPGQEAVFNITLQNSGDEAAYDVQLSLVLPEGMAANQIYLGQVQPMIPKSSSFNVRIDPSLTPGKYSIAVLTEYKDANGYPFSSMTPNYIVVGEARSSQVSGTIEAVSLGDKTEKKKLSLLMRNLDNKPHEVRIRMFVPKELNVKPETASVTLDAKTEATKEFEISSFGALAGSTYVVFAAMNYEDGGSHYSSTASGMVSIVKYEEKIGGSTILPAINTNMLYIIGAILLIIAVVGIQLFHSPGKNKKSNKSP